MAEEAGEKRLPASAQKRRRAREEGKIARSQDLSSAAALLVALIALRFLGAGMFTRMEAITRHYLSQADYILLSSGTMQRVALEALWQAAPMLLPFMIIMILGGIAANVLQVGILVTGKPLTPKLQNVNPFSGFGNLFNAQALVKLLRSLILITVVVYIVWLTMRGRLDYIVTLMEQTPRSLVPAVGALVFLIWWRCVLAMLVIGALDYGFQYWQNERRLMMTHQEAQEELKQFEGDPQIKRRIRHVQRQIAMQRMMANVPTADVVITNPTQYAVALRYNVNAMAAPVVVAKGARLVAERIRDLAVEHDVPIVQKPELARTLYRTLEVDEPVPERLFRAVADILAYVYRIDRRAEKIRERSQVWGTTPQAA